MPAPDFHNYADKLHRAASRVDENPTDAQREALNYRQGKVFMHGLDIAIEYKKDSYRSGTDSSGKKWTRKMNAHYGRLRNTIGEDDEPVDVFIGSHPTSQLVFVISQLDDEGNLDEHKCLLCCINVKEAKDLYLSHYPDNWEDKHLGEIRTMTMPTFKKWLKTKYPVKNKKSKQAFIEVPVTDVNSVINSIFYN